MNPKLKQILVKSVNKSLVKAKLGDSVNSTDVTNTVNMAVNRVLNTRFIVEQLGGLVERSVDQALQELKDNNK